MAPKSVSQTPKDLSVRILSNELPAHTFVRLRFSSFYVAILPSLRTCASTIRRSFDSKLLLMPSSSSVQDQLCHAASKGGEEKISSRPTTMSIMWPGLKQATSTQLSCSPSEDILVTCSSDMIFILSFSSFTAFVSCIRSSSAHEAGQRPCMPHNKAL